MKSYNVKEIAEMLNTNPETVRRWIRDKKLDATIVKRVVTSFMRRLSVSF